MKVKEALEVLKKIDPEEEVELKFKSSSDNYDSNYSYNRGGQYDR